MYIELKVLLSGFFTYIEKGQPDNRYLDLLNSISHDSLGKFYPNVNIVSWNYDMQIEKSYSIISGINDHEEIQQDLGLIPRLLHRTTIRQNNLNVFKLNGNSTLYSTKERSFSPFLKTPYSWTDESFIKSLIYNYAAAVYRQDLYNSNLSFAWEKDWNEVSSTVISSATEIFKRSKIVVIIVYSFQVFNREVDRILFEQFKKIRTNKIIIQDKYPQIVQKNMQEGALNECEAQIELNSFTDRFIVPSLIR